MNGEEVCTPIEDEYNSYPIEIVTEMALKQIQAGGIVFFKFTCGHCHSRQTFDTPNKLYERGICEECGKVSKITRAGLTLMLIKGGEIK